MNYKNNVDMKGRGRLASLLLVTAILLLAVPAKAQEAAVPKWGSKVQKGVVSVVSYDKDGNQLKSGTGFYISNDGIAIADYELFYGAYSAIVSDMNGKKNKVERILGANDTYSLVRFKVATEKSVALECAPSKAQEGAVLFAMKYSSDKVKTCPTTRVNEAKAVGEPPFPFYTLSFAIDESYLGAPLLNAKGQVVATVQPSIGLNGYGLGIQFIDTLKIQAIASQMNSLALDNIHMPKGLPDNLEESLVYLYIKSSTMKDDEYLDLTNLFVKTYPDNAEGYYRRATPLIDLAQFDEADKDLQQYYKLSEDKAVASSRIADVIFTKLVYQPTPEYSKWNYDVALEYIDKAIELSPNELNYTLMKSRILMAKKDYNGALAIYDELNKSENRGPSTFYAAALAHEGLGDTATIQIELLDSAIALFPTPLPGEAASYVLRRGQLHERVGHYRDAVQDYNQYAFLCNSKVNAKFYYDKSKLEVKARMYQQALDDLNTAINKAPGTVLYYVEKSGLLLRVNEIDECIAAAQQALEIAPDNADAYRIMGYAQIQKGDVEAGKKSLQKAIDLGDEMSKELIKDYIK